MIDRFNFYDVYGYFLPGVALLAFLLVPLDQLGFNLAAVDWQTFLLGAPFAYLAGHLVQQVSVATLRTEIKDEEGNWRYPSDPLLDEDGSGLSGSVRTQIVRYAAERLGLAVGGPRKEHNEKRAQERRDLFFICRKRLVDAGRGRYVEQYQGMYSLMIGLCGAATLGAGLSVGCAVGPWLSLPVWGVRTVLALAGLSLLAVSLYRQDWRRSLWALAAVACVLGVVVGSAAGPSQGLFPLWIVPILATFVARRSYHSYRYFEKTMAKAVYRDFVALLDAETAERPSSSSRA